MLAQTLGPGKAQVVVNADLNANQATSESAGLRQEGRAAYPADADRDAQGRRRHGRRHGTGTIPAYAATGSGGNSNYNNKTTNTTYGVNKTITHIVDRARHDQQPDASRCWSTSRCRPRSCRRSATRSAGAVGLNAKRGDTLSVCQIAFAKTADDRHGRLRRPKMIGYAKYAVIGLGALLFLFFMRRNLKRREQEIVRRPADLAARAGDARGRSPRWPRRRSRSRRPRSSACARRSTSPKRQVEELVERDPDRVAQQVRAWMYED